MNSSAQPIRRIASNLLWTPRGVVRNPLVCLATDGEVLSVGECADPDRSPFTEFYAGMLVPDFPAGFQAAFEQMCMQMQTPLPELLTALPRPASGGVLVVISGLDYAAMKLTPHSRIQKIG